MTNDPLEFPPGNYVVELNGSRQTVMVQERQRADVIAGAVAVVRIRSVR